jgi:single-stranded DNA-specific DHH superfamily exonuclease
MGLLDLVALATVADVAPLIGVNRAFVRQGLKVMARRDRVGLRALADVARMDQAPTPYALGFVLGPRVNAGGRIGQADLGARLLACDSPTEAAAMAARLDELNSERREITEAVREAAMAQAEARATAMVSEAIAQGNVQAINYFVAQKYVEALKELASAPNQKVLLLPMESTGILGALAGVAELTKDAMQRQPSQNGGNASRPPRVAPPVGN